jgi:hypothetical protein
MISWRGFLRAARAMCPVCRSTHDDLIAHVTQAHAHYHHHHSPHSRRSSPLDWPLRMREGAYKSSFLDELTLLQLRDTIGAPVTAARHLAAQLAASTSLLAPVCDTARSPSAILPDPPPAADPRDMISVYVMLLVTSSRDSVAQDAFGRVMAAVSASPHPPLSPVLCTNWLTFGAPLVHHHKLETVSPSEPVKTPKPTILTVDGMFYSFLAGMQLLCDRRSIYPQHEHTNAIEPPVRVMVLSDNPQIARTCSAAALSVLSSVSSSNSALGLNDGVVAASQRRFGPSNGKMMEVSASSKRKDALVVVPYPLPSKKHLPASTELRWAKYLHQAIHCS